MKKIGILTYHQAINYGAVLQAYALKNTLENYQYEVSVIDYRNKELTKIHALKKLTQSQNIKDILRYFLIFRNANKKHIKFKEFNRAYLNLSQTVYNSNDVKLLNFDKYIVGSDQVWNTEINKEDWVYFLKDIPKEKSYSYAASIGLSYISKPDEFYDLLKDFQHITVREKIAANLLEDIGIKGVNTVLDPTLLLDKKEWSEKLSLRQMNKERYLLVYAFSGSKNIRKKALEISKAKNLKIKWIANTYSVDKNIEYIKTADPIEFLNFFYNAEFIITNSFHGTAFSINFEKEFIVELLQGNSKVNSRIENVLNEFGVSDRILSSLNQEFENKIDYKKVNVMVAQKRNESIAELARMLR